MPELVDAFEEALDSAEEEKGFREKVTFRTQQIDVLLHEPQVDPDLGSAGTTSSQPVRLGLRKSDVLLPVAPNESITVRGVAMSVLSHSVLTGYLSIVAGDLSSELGDV